MPVGSGYFGDFKITQLGAYGAACFREGLQNPIRQPNTA